MFFSNELLPQKYFDLTQSYTGGNTIDERIASEMPMRFEIMTSGGMLEGAGNWVIVNRMAT